MKNEEDLIKKLLEETCTDEKESFESLENVAHLSDYFEKKVNQVEFLSFEKYIIQQEIEAHLVEFQKSTGCYRLVFNQMTLDFPSNWSVFEGLSVYKVTLVNHENDRELLCDIFSEVFGSCESFILINNENKFNFLLFRNSEYLDHYQWLLNYFSKKELIQLKPAA